MKVPLYILGLLKRFGPQHGYQIKKNMVMHVADFAHIKLPTIYYHLDRMEKNGLIVSSQEKGGNRPERWVYSNTPEGERELQKILNSFIKKAYQAEFDLDAVLFFFEFNRDRDQIIESLRFHMSSIKRTIQELEIHRQEVAVHLSREENTIASLLFAHHEKHYRAEYEWLSEAIQALEEV